MKRLYPACSPCIAYIRTSGHSAGRTGSSRRSGLARDSNACMPGDASIRRQAAPTRLPDIAPDVQGSSRRSGLARDSNACTPGNASIRRQAGSHKAAGHGAGHTEAAVGAGLPAIATRACPATLPFAGKLLPHGTADEPPKHLHLNLNPLHLSTFAAGTPKKHSASPPTRNTSAL